MVGVPLGAQSRPQLVVRVVAVLDSPAPPEGVDEDELEVVLGAGFVVVAPPEALVADELVDELVDAVDGVGVDVAAAVLAGVVFPVEALV